MESNLVKLEQQVRKYSAELDSALLEYNALKAQAADFDLNELSIAQLEICPQKEASAESKIQTVYGIKYDFWTMISAEKDVSKVLNEKDPHAVRERVQRKVRQWENREAVTQPKKKDHGWER